MISCSCVPSSPEPSLPNSVQLLCEQYHRHALEVRQVTLETARKQLAYQGRFFEHFGSRLKPAELLKRLEPKSISDFLIKYAENHGTGARRWMHLSLRVFLRFCHEYGYLSRELSVLVPAVRTPKSQPHSALPAERMHRHTRHGTA